MNHKGMTILATIVFVVVIMIVAIIGFRWLSDRNPVNENFYGPDSSL